MSWKIFSAKGEEGGKVRRSWQMFHVLLKEPKTSVRLQSPTQTSGLPVYVLLQVWQNESQLPPILSIGPPRQRRVSFVYISTNPASLFASSCVLLVEEVVVDFDLGVGFEVIRQQHDGNRHLVEVIDLKGGRWLIKRRSFKQPTSECKIKAAANVYFHHRLITVELKRSVD